MKYSLVTFTVLLPNVFFFFPFDFVWNNYTYQGSIFLCILLYSIECIIYNNESLYISILMCKVCSRN